MDPHFVHPHHLRRNGLLPTPIMPIPGVNSYHRNSFTPSSNQLPPQQQNFILNHNYAYSQFTTSCQNVNHQNFYLEAELTSLQQRYAQLEHENVNLRGFLSNPNTVPKEQYDEVLKRKETVAVNNEQLIKNDKHHANQSEIFKQQKQDLEQSLKASEKNLEDKISSLQKSHATAVKELEDSVSKEKLKVLELERNLEKECNEVTLLTEKSNYFNNHIKDLESERAALQAEYEQFKSQNEEDVSKLKLQLEISGEKVNALGDENENLKEKIKASECEMTTLQTEYEQKNSKNEEKVGKLQLELKTVKTMLADKEKELGIGASERHSIRIDKDRIIAKNKVETDNIKKSLEGATKNVCSLAGDKAKLLDEVKSLKDKVFTLQKEKQVVAKNNENVIQLNQHLKEAKAEIQLQKERIRKLQQQKANAKLEFDAEIKRRQEKVDKDKSDYDQLFSENVTFGKTKQELTEKLKLEKEKCKEVQSRCDEVTKSKEKLQTQVEAGKATVQNIKQKFNDLKNSHQIALKELKSSCEKVELLTAENRTLQNEKQKIIALNKEEVSKLNEEIKEAQAELHQREEIIEKLGSEFEKEMLEFNSEREQLEQELESESELLRQATTATLDQNNKMLKKAKAAAEVLKTQVESLRSEKESLSSQLDCSLKDAQNLQAENTSLRETSKTTLRSECTKAIDALKLKNKNLQNQLEQSNKRSLQEYADQSMQHQESMKKIHKANDEIDSLKSQVTSLERSLEEKKKILAKQKNELRNNEKYVTQLTKLQSENKKLKLINKTEKADRFREESPAKKARKESFGHDPMMMISFGK